MGPKTYAVLLVCLAWSPISVAGQTATNLRELGRREYIAGNYVEGESYFRSALKAADLDDAARAAILSELGTVLLDEERLSEAEETFSKSLAIHKRRGDKDATAGVLRQLGAVYSMGRRDVEAISALNRALK